MTIVLTTQVPAFCLKVSEVWEPLTGEDKVMINEDNVVSISFMMMLTRSGPTLRSDNGGGVFGRLDVERQDVPAYVRSC